MSIMTVAIRSYQETVSAQTQASYRQNSKGESEPDLRCSYDCEPCLPYAQSLQGLFVFYLITLYYNHTSYSHRNVIRWGAILHGPCEVHNASCNVRALRSSRSRQCCSFIPESHLLICSARRYSLSAMPTASNVDTLLDA